MKQANLKWGKGLHLMVTVVVTSRNRWRGDIFRMRVTACYGRQPLIGGQWRELHSQGNCHLPSKVKKQTILSEFLSLQCLQNFFCSVPRKMPGHVKLGASGEPDPGALVQTNLNPLKQENKSPINCFRSAPLPCGQQCYQEVGYILFLYSISQFVVDTFHQKGSSKAVRSQKSCMDT